MEINETIELQVQSITPWPEGMSAKSVYLKGEREDGTVYLVSIQTEKDQRINVNDTFELKLLYREPQPSADKTKAETVTAA